MLFVKPKKPVLQSVFVINHHTNSDDHETNSAMIAQAAMDLNMPAHLQNGGTLLNAFSMHARKNKPELFFCYNKPETSLHTMATEGYSLQKIDSTLVLPNRKMQLGTQVTYHYGRKRRFDPCQRLLQEAENPNASNGFDKPWEDIGGSGLHYKDTCLQPGPEGFKGAKWKFHKFASNFEQGETFARSLLLHDFFETLVKVVLTKSRQELEHSADMLALLKPTMGIVHENHHHGMHMVSATETTFKAGLCTSAVALPNEEDVVVETCHYFSLTVNR